MDWEIKVKFAGNTFTLRAEKVYESAQIMRIKINGSKGHIILENDYPFLQATHSKKAIKWKVREGRLDGKDKEQEAQLIVDIIHLLEDKIKNKKPFAHAEYLRTTKW